MSHDVDFLYSRVAMERRAKIVATLGPACSSERQLARLIRAGVDVVRLNLSHGTRESHRELIRRTRRVADELDRFVGIVADLQGPRYRLGDLPGGLLLEKRQLVTLGAVAGTDLPLAADDIFRHVKVGERLLIDNGLVELEVLSRRRGVVKTKVIAGGEVASRKGINLPDSNLPFRISQKDRLDIAMAVEEGVDFLAASYVGRGRDVDSIRRVARAAGEALPVIAKLERARAIEHLDEIIDRSNAVMVARGDLGVEIPLHEVPVLQKRIINACWRLGKPVIVATQMLESMIEQSRPTRAESTDVANAVFDGADALMLSGETAVGRNPTEVVRTMKRIIVEAESHQLEGARKATASGRESLGGYDIEPPVTAGSLKIPETIAAAAVQTAKQLGARRIVALTENGFTVRMLARRRPSTPVTALTQNQKTARQVQLIWGVRALAMHGDVKHHDEVVGLVDRHLLAARLARPKDTVAILMGDPISERPPTNLLRIHRVLRRPQSSASKWSQRKRKRPSRRSEASE